MKKLNRDFFCRETDIVAKELLGKELVFNDGVLELVAEITETEAYMGINDKACHSYGGKRTARTENMYRNGGYSYIYLIYGMYAVFNVITQTEQEPTGVMLRGTLPVKGTDYIAQNRFGKKYDELLPRHKKALMDGPGKICKGMGLTTAQNGIDMTCSDILYIRESGVPKEFGVGAGKRVNIDYAEEDAELLLRFYQIPIKA